MCLCEKHFYDAVSCVGDFLAFFSLNQELAGFPSDFQMKFSYNFNEKVEFPFSEYGNSINFWTNPAGSSKCGRFVHHLAVHRA